MVKASRSGPSSVHSQKLSQGTCRSVGSRRDRRQGPWSGRSVVSHCQGPSETHPGDVVATGNGTSTRSSWPHSHQCHQDLQRTSSAIPVHGLDRVESASPGPGPPSMLVAGTGTAAYHGTVCSSSLGPVSWMTFVPWGSRPARVSSLLSESSPLATML